MWQRPPENLCDRCSAFSAKVAEEKVLMNAINAIPGSPGYDVHRAVIEQHGGRAGATESVIHIVSRDWLLVPYAVPGEKWRLKSWLISCK